VGEGKQDDEEEDHDFAEVRGVIEGSGGPIIGKLGQDLECAEGQLYEEKR
jgi:hypothetical protein